MLRSLLFLAVVLCCSNACAETTVRFDSLPFALAQKIVKGNGHRRLAYFTDPYCSFCKKLEAEFKDIDDITLYLFLYPVFPGADEVVRNVLCSDNPNKAWDDWMLKNVRPPKKACPTETEKVLALGKRLGVNGTPTLIFSDGSIVAGYQPSASLELMLFAAESK